MEAIPPSRVAAMGNDSSFEFVGCLTRAEAHAQAQITEASGRIIEQGFDAAMFTAKAVCGAFLMTKHYLKLAKQFTRHEDPRIRVGLLNYGISNNIICIPASATFVDVLRFLKFLRSPAGQQVQYDEQQKAKLLRKAGKTFKAAIRLPGSDIAVGQESGETPKVMGSFVTVGQVQPSSAEDQEQIIEASACIIEQGFDAAMFTTNAISGSGLSTKQYLKLATQFTRHNDRGIRDGLLSHCISNNIIGKPSSATFSDVVKFLYHLRSPTGQQVQYSEQQKAKLRRKQGRLHPRTW